MSGRTRCFTWVRSSSKRRARKMRQCRGNFSEARPAGLRVWGRRLVNGFPNYSPTIHFSRFCGTLLCQRRRGRSSEFRRVSPSSLHGPPTSTGLISTPVSQSLESSPALTFSRAADWSVRRRGKPLSCGRPGLWSAEFRSIRLLITAPNPGGDA